jgi:NitT/TauT family transport system permease protein
VTPLGRLGNFLWSGWAGLAGLCLLAAAWQAGHEAYGSFILPAPAQTLQQVAALIADPRFAEAVGTTAQRAATGFVFAAGIGAVIGIAAGYSMATIRAARPLMTVLLGVPPIAWIVLAMIWFGAGDGTVVATVVIAATPIVFGAAAEGIATRERGLDDMARVFGASALQRFGGLALRHLAAHLFPALAVALGTAVKVAVMAELLTNTGGIGTELANARSRLDVSAAMAWVLIAVTLLLVLEYALLQPVRAQLERWRSAAQPWGVKR